MLIPKPNYTQTPNTLFDDIAKTLKEGELRVLLALVRFTFGWGNKLWDRISLSQLSEKTGMERKSVCRSLKTLIEKKIVTKHKTGTNGEQECWYSLIVENASEFSNPIDDSNNSYQCPKDTPPSVLKTPTKETLTKESISPIVPKGDRVASRKLKVEEKKQVMAEVFLTQAQQDDLLKRLGGDNQLLLDCYDRLSRWKIGAGITGGRNDYKSITNWVIGAVRNDRASGKGNSTSKVEEDKTLVEQIKKRFPDHKVLDYGYNYIGFNYGPMKYDEIKFGESGFRERVTNNLRKINLTL